MLAKGAFDEAKTKHEATLEVVERAATAFSITKEDLEAAQSKSQDANQRKLKVTPVREAAASLLLHCPEHQKKALQQILLSFCKVPGQEVALGVNPSSSPLATSQQPANTLSHPAAAPVRKDRSQ